MRSNHSLLTGLVLLLLSSAAVALPSIQHWRSAKGAEVYFVATEGLPIVDARLVFTAGSAYDAKQNGVAALTSALLDQGAAGQTTQQIAERLENVGAQLSTASSRDFTTLSFRSLSDEKALASSWAVLQQVLSQPDFPLTDFQREKERTLLSIKRREESPGVLAQLALYREIYRGHPYAKPVRGTSESVAMIERGDLRRFYQRYYVANNLKLILVGGISRQQAEQMVAELLADLPAGEKAMPIVEVAELAEGKNIHVEYPSQQTHLMYGLPVLKHNDADNYALYVGNHILGGSGFSSRIVKEIREERGLAYSAYSYFHPMLQKGPFLLGLQTRNEKLTEAAVAAKKTLLEFVEQGVSEEELVAAKKNISGGFALRLDSNKKLLASVASIVASGVELDYLDRYLDNIDAVSIANIQDAFRRRLVVDKMVMVTVGQIKGDTK